jgi:hypothetical protein
LKSWMKNACQTLFWRLMKNSSPFRG